ncbi:MAG TPA: phosphodiesterase [Casimicrobiaceae bacterium]|nr:phosphodiesterase [Casimicrobiaceae bacterium]
MNTESATYADDLVHRIARFERLTAVFQPVFALKDCSVMGFEGLIRGPEGTTLHAPAALFDAAERSGVRTQLELMSARRVVREFASHRFSGTLLVNLSCTALIAAEDKTGRMLSFLDDAGVSPSSVMIELTEHDRVRDVTELARVLEPLRRAGVALALDDFGDGHSNLRLWMELHPRLVKIDKFFVRGLGTNGDKFEIVRLLQRFAESFGTELVAEGIEDIADLIAARDLGISLAQGFLLAYPASVPRMSLAPDVAAVLRSTKLSVPPNRDNPRTRLLFAGDLSYAIPPVSATVSANALAQTFGAHPDCHAVAVVEDERPIGIINRQSFMDRYAQPFQREIYGRKSCAHFMSEAPLVVDRRTPLEALRAILAGEDQRYLRDGFIVSDNGRYVGLASGETLVRAVTELRIEAARYANPLTFLPGNIPITQHLERLLAKRVAFAACYADLNHFKPFNDQYGYWRGDEVICLAGKILGQRCDPLVDFIGHVGGDDFFLIMQSDDWRDRCLAAIAQFNERVRSHFPAREVEAGGFWGEDRKGARYFFPLTTISMGVVMVDPEDTLQADDIASAAGAMKRRAKTRDEGLCVSTIAAVRASGLLPAQGGGLEQELRA